MPISTTAKIDLIDTDPTLATSLMTGPVPQDDFIGGVSIGADYQKYMQMRRDPHVRTVLQRRRQSVLARRVLYEFPKGFKAGDRTTFERLAASVRYESLCSALLNSGQLIGFAVVQLDMERNDADQIVPTWKFVPQNRFVFSWHEPSDRSIPSCSGESLDPKTDIILIHGYELRLLTRSHPIKGERCPKGRFIVYTFDSDESPWGLGLGYSIYPWAVVKREAMKAWLLHSDRVGSPPVLGSTPEQIDESEIEYQRLVRRFEDFLKAVSPNAWARLPAGFEAKVMDLLSNASPDVHERLIKTANDEISKVVLGEVPYSDKSTGSYAANISQVEDREASLIDADVNLLDEQMQSQFWVPLTELNYPEQPVPIVRRETRADDREKEAEKLAQEAKKSRIDQDKTMQDLGYRVKPERAAEIYGDEYVDASSIKESDSGEEAPQALAAILGPRTDTLLSFLQALPQNNYPRASAIAVVSNVFGIPRAIAETLVPEASEAPAEEEPNLAAALSGIADADQPEIPEPEAAPEPETPVAPPAASPAPAFIELEPPYEFPSEFAEPNEHWADAIAAIPYWLGLSALNDEALQYLETNYAAIAAQIATELIEATPVAYTEIGRRVAELYQEHLELQEFFAELAAITDGTFYEFAPTPTTKTAKKKNCTPGKSHFCQKPGGAGTCIPLSKKCGYQPTGPAQQAANYIGQQVNGATPPPASAPAKTTKKTTKKTAKTAPPAPPSTPPSPIKTNQGELDKSRADLEKRFGTKTVEAAEANVKRILDDPDTSVYVRVGSASTLELILGDRFKTAHELGSNATVPNMKGPYLDNRARVEAKSLGYDPKKTKPEDRPIYGYLAGKDPNGAAHADVSAYGSITIKLKPEAKDRSTFTAADSFKSGIASQVKSDGTPPPPNAASIVASTRHGYDTTNLPSHLAHLDSTNIHGSQLRQAAKAKSIDDLVGIGAPTGQRYVEAQVHGKVGPKDIAEIAFTPKGQGDKPTPAIAQFAKDNGVPITINGKKLSDKELDDIITPPKDKRSQDLQRLAKALDDGDFDAVATYATAIDQKAQAVKLNPGERDNTLKALYQESGYDGLPKVGTSADLDKIHADGGLLMVRGVAPDPTDKLKYLRDMQSGDYHTGNGVYGNGTYVGHSGHVKNGQFIPKNGPTAAKDAKSAVDNVAKHGYISSTTLNMRMAADPTEFNVVTQSQLRQERRALESQVDAWAAGEQQKILAGAKVATQKDVTAFDRRLKKVTGQYDVNQTSITSRQVISSRREMQTWDIPGQPGRKGVQATVELTTHRSMTGRILYEFTYRDASGKPVATAVEAGQIPTKATMKKLSQEIVDHEAMLALGVDRRPQVGDINDPVAANRLKDFKERVAKTKTVLGLDDNGESNLAVIRGYDAVALDQSYEPGDFMNLLNRSKLTIQDQPLDWTRAKKKGAA